ncbi:hypothetical protein JI57_03275 [Psychromonas sp. PRT-SC03]|nr:hypothetical protein JI57_03275 [Psychromonas sp. PRT-SC03]
MVVCLCTLSLSACFEKQDKLDLMYAEKHNSATKIVDNIAYLEFLYKQQRSAKVSAQGRVINSLPLQSKPYLAQLFLVRLISGQKIIIKHNIETGRALPAVEDGSLLFFKGLYKWNHKGGMIVFTTKKNNQNKLSGWLKYNEITYQ